VYKPRRRLRTRVDGRAAVHSNSAAIRTRRRGAWAGTLRVQQTHLPRSRRRGTNAYKTQSSAQRRVTGGHAVASDAAPPPCALPTRHKRWSAILLNTNAVYSEKRTRADISMTQKGEAEARIDDTANAARAWRLARAKRRRSMFFASHLSSTAFLISRDTCLLQKLAFATTFTLPLLRLSTPHRQRTRTLAISI